LEPYISKRSVEIHWGKHHNEHVERLNKLLETSPFYGHTLEEMVKATYNNGSPLIEFNEASSVSFFLFIFILFVYLFMYLCSRGCGTCVVFFFEVGTPKAYCEISLNQIKKKSTAWV
jgi:Iron/manganese superoxide dismutases, alpha-hairpin domain